MITVTKRAGLAIMLAWGASLFGAVSANAGVIVQPVTATTNMGSFNTFEPIYAINQSALSSPYTSGVTDFDTYAPATNTSGAGSSFTTWFSASGNITGNFDFGLSSIMTIESFALWADPQSANQGVKDFRLLADDNSSFSSPTLLGTYAAVDGLGNANNFGQIFTFAPVSASFVRMEILSNHGSTLTTGIVEGAFEATTVPIPAAAWLFGSGMLGLIGFARRRGA